jgi:hypothetical protein
MTETYEQSQTQETQSELIQSIIDKKDSVVQKMQFFEIYEQELRRTMEFYNRKFAEFEQIENNAIEELENIDRELTLYHQYLEAKYLYLNNMVLELARDLATE